MQSELEGFGKVDANLASYDREGADNFLCDCEHALAPEFAVQALPDMAIQVRRLRIPRNVRNGAVSLTATRLRSTEFGPEQRNR